ncbi:hypothetical protein [Rhodococcus marinonascens]|uniref:hypothetical protein n=1 Tax=Rhodococcus marinonascens TaxID=38311 RepID=UPI0009FFF4AB|nr:hypothetical protein [Rhodococcus marinonascens]
MNRFSNFGGNLADRESVRGLLLGSAAVSAMVLGMAPMGEATAAADDVVATIDLDYSANDVEISPDGSRAYATDGIQGSLIVIDTPTDTVVDTVPVGENPNGVTVTPDGTRVYVANSGSEGQQAVEGSVSVIDTATDTVVETIDAGVHPYQVAVAPDGAFVYVTNDWYDLYADVGTGALTVIDTATNAVTDTVPIGNSAKGLAVTPDGSGVFVADFTDDSVKLIDSVTHDVDATIAVEKPWRVAAVPGTTAPDISAYVTSVADNTVSVVSYFGLGVTIPVGEQPWGVDVSPDGKYAYVANNDGSSLTEIETSTNTVRGTVPLDGHVWDVSVAPDGSFAYVAGHGLFRVSLFPFADLPQSPQT